MAEWQWFEKELTTLLWGHPSISLFEGKSTGRQLLAVVHSRIRQSFCLDMSIDFPIETLAGEECVVQPLASL